MSEEELEEIRRGIALYKQLRALERAGMHGSVVAEMARVVPTSLVRDIVRDFRRGVSQPSSIEREPEVRGSGWVDPAPLGPPPGIKLIDRMMAAEDRQWRRQRAREFGVEPLTPTIKRRV